MTSKVFLRIVFTVWREFFSMKSADLVYFVNNITGSQTFSFPLRKFVDIITDKMYSRPKNKRKRIESLPQF